MTNSTKARFWREVAAAFFFALLPAGAAEFALTGARIYPAADAPAISNGAVLIRDGRIAAVGSAKEVLVWPNIQRLDCSGLTALPGFWNCHVHFTEPKWENAAALSPAKLEVQLGEMFTRYGFTTVFDTGSLAENTNAIRRRIRSGEVRGPLILTAGVPIAPKDGSPYYLLPLKLPEIENPGQGPAMVHERLETGSDAIKIFTGSWATRQRVVAMPLECVRAITAEAHRLGRLVISHPSDMSGLAAAVDGGVDILAHTVERAGGLDRELLARMKARGMSLIPTLKLFSRETGFDAAILPQAREYAALGGQILFGTDVGFLPVYDPTQEYELLGRAGLDFRRILAALTTAPAARYGFADRKGRIAPGMDADLVLLAQDPASAGPAAFSSVRYTIQGGSVVGLQPAH